MKITPNKILYIYLALCLSTLAIPALLSRQTPAPQPFKSRPDQNAAWTAPLSPPMPPVPSEATDSPTEATDSDRRTQELLSIADSILAKGDNEAKRLSPSPAASPKSSTPRQSHGQ